MRVGHLKTLDVTSISTLAKLFQYCLLQKLQKYAGFHDLQLGLIEGGGM